MSPYFSSMGEVVESGENQNGAACVALFCFPFRSAFIYIFIYIHRLYFLWGGVGRMLGTGCSHGVFCVPHAALVFSMLSTGDRFSTLVFFSFRNFLSFSTAKLVADGPIMSTEVRTCWLLECLA